MHINTATNCRSHYTVAVGQVEFTCEMPLERHAAPGFRGLLHRAQWGGELWFWSDEEAD